LSVVFICCVCKYINNRQKHPCKAGQKTGIKIANRSFEIVAKFKYLGTTLTDQNCMQEENKSDKNGGMLATIRSRVFRLPASCLGT
jgi:hypothetical protein